MRQVLRFTGTFIVTLAAYALLMVFGVGGILGRIYISTLLVLMCCILGDVFFYLTNKLPVSKFDVAADLLGVGAGFVVLLVL
jgi:hypothetical protein